MSAHDGNVCATSRPAPPPPPLRGGPPPPLSRWRMKLTLADLFQNFLRVLAEPRRRAVRGHRGAVEHDRGANAGAGAAFGGGVFQGELHAAMDHLRIGEDLLQIVDRTGGNASRLELVQTFFSVSSSC